MTISIVGVDLSKSVFQLSLADAKHRVIDRKRFSRTQFHRFLAQNTRVVKKLICLLISTS
jgi:hypothetical protein